MEKNDFVTRFKGHVDKGGIGPFDGIFDPFSSSKNDYRGSVDLNGFKIKRRRKFFDRNKFMVIASGTYRQRLDKLEIVTEVDGLNRLVIPVFVIVLLFYIFFISAFSFAATQGDANFFSFLPFILLHGLLMIGIPYFMIRKSVQNMIRDLEKDFLLMSIQ